MHSAYDPLGVGMGLTTGFLWAIAPICFASAGRRIGSYSVALIRCLLAGLVLLVCVALAIQAPAGHVVLPNARQTEWMALSGLFGMGVGDILIYRALVLIGAQQTTQLLLLSPLVSVLVAWAWLGETLAPRAGAGAALVLAATFYTVHRRAPEPRATRNDDTPEGSSHTPHWVGFACAAAGAVSTGMGAVTGRLAFQAGPAVDPILMTTLRVWSAFFFLLPLPLLRGEIGAIFAHLRDRWVLIRVGLGAACGPFLGMICYVTALKHAPAGLVSTLTATSPLFVLPLLALRRRTRIQPGAAIAAVVALAGVALVCGR